MNGAGAKAERPRRETPEPAPSRPPISQPATTRQPPTDLAALQAGVGNSAIATAATSGYVRTVPNLIPNQGVYGNAAVVGQQMKSPQYLGQKEEQGTRLSNEIMMGRQFQQGASQAGARNAPLDAVSNKAQTGIGDANNINVVGVPTAKLAQMDNSAGMNAKAAVRNVDRGRVAQIKDNLQPDLEAITARGVADSRSRQVGVANIGIPAGAEVVGGKATQDRAQPSPAGKPAKPRAEEPAPERPDQDSKKVPPEDQEKAEDSQKAKPARKASPDVKQSVGDGGISSESGGEMPATPAAVRVPQPVMPVDAGGQPLPADPSADEMIAQLAEQAQVVRTQASALRQQAAEMRTTAQLLRTNVGLVRKHVAESDSGLAQAQEQNTFRRSVVDQGPAAVQASEAKAKDVASRAPQGEARAQQERARSQPMAGEARDLVGQSQANVPRDDPDAAAKAQEQSGKLSRVGGDIARVDEAVAQAGQAAGQLGQDAAHAAQQNSVASGKIDAARASVDQSDAHIGDLQGRNAAATAQLEGLAGGPAQLQTQADALDAEAGRLMARSQQLETQLHEIQESYATGMRNVPAVQEPAPETEAAPEGGMGEAPVSAEAEVASEPESVAPEIAAPEAGTPATEPLESREPNQPGTGEETEEPAATQPPAAPPESPGEEQKTGSEGKAGAKPAPQPIDLGKGLGWLTGEKEPNAEDRQRAQAAEDDRRNKALQIAQSSAEEDFASLSAGEKRTRALRIVGQNLFGGVGKITWADVGKGAVKLAKGLIDPRSALAGVISGLNIIVNGVAGFVHEPSWGGALKAAADVALGLTIILGSITALAGLIIAAMIALSVVTVGVAAPITGPVIAFCTTVMTTVGAWTFYVGLVAAGLQALVFLKDLYMAGTAQTADQLVVHADAMTQDASNTGNALLQAGMGKLAQVGGRQLQGAIAIKGGGVGFARQIGQRSLLGQAVRGSRLATRISGGGRLARVAAGARIFSRGVARGVARGARGALRGIAGAPGRVIGRIGRGLRAARRLGFGRTARVLGQRGWRAIAPRTGFREGLKDIRAGFSREFLKGEGAPIRAPGTRALPAAPIEPVAPPAKTPVAAQEPLPKPVEAEPPAAPPPAKAEEAAPPVKAKAPEVAPPPKAEVPAAAPAEAPAVAPPPKAEAPAAAPAEAPEVAPPPKAEVPAAAPAAPETAPPPKAEVPAAAPAAPETAPPAQVPKPVEETELAVRHKQHIEATQKRIEQAEQARSNALADLQKAENEFQSARREIEVAKSERAQATRAADIEVATELEAEAEERLKQASRDVNAAQGRAEVARKEGDRLVATLEHQKRIAGELDKATAERDAILKQSKNLTPPLATEEGRRLLYLEDTKIPRLERELGLQIESAKLPGSEVSEALRSGTPPPKGSPARVQADTNAVANFERAGLTAPTGEPIDVSTGEPLAASKVSPDHIHPVDKILREEGFNLLSTKDQLEILELPENYMPLTKELNSSKGTRTLSEWFRNTPEGKKVPLGVRPKVLELEERAKQAVQREIKNRLSRR